MNIKNKLKISSLQNNTESKTDQKVSGCNLCNKWLPTNTKPNAFLKTSYVSKRIKKCLNCKIVSKFLVLICCNKWATLPIIDLIKKGRSGGGGGGRDMSLRRIGDPWLLISLVFGVGWYHFCGQNEDINNDNGMLRGGGRRA